MSQNCPPPLEDSGTHLIHGSLGATEATSQMASRLVQLVVVTNRQRDRQTDRPHYICSTYTPVSWPFVQDYQGEPAPER